MRFPLPAAIFVLMFSATNAQSQSTALRTGVDALTGWEHDSPGVRRHIKVADLPVAPPAPPDPEAAAGKPVKVVERPKDALPKVPAGFQVQVFATGLKQPRTLRVAPNGDIFLSESGAGRVLVFRDTKGAEPKPEVFADKLEKPYGIVFHPPGKPRHVYVAAANQVVRYPYREGTARATGPAEVIVRDIPTKRHWTRDLAVTRDGAQFFVSIGSASNLGVNGMPAMTPEKIREFEQSHGRGAAWGEEENRAVVRVFDADGGNLRNHATGLRNCSGLAMRPGTDELWCVVNERDHLGRDLVPDFMARVQQGDFFGWPWFYLGDTQDPALSGRRADLEGHVRTPEVLFQAHSSALAVVFYDHEAFPDEYRGDAFVTLHGSHTRPDRTGYKVVRVRMRDGKATGEYQDFMTGFLVDNDTAWGRPAGVAVTRDGDLLVSDDANGTIYRVTHR